MIDYIAITVFACIVTFVLWLMEHYDPNGDHADRRAAARRFLLAPLWPVIVPMLVVRVVIAIVKDAFGEDR